MKKLIIGAALVLTSLSSFATERAFRIDSTASVVNGLAIAWGIPGVNLDFEKLDALPYEEVEKQVDLNAVRNFIVDIKTNKIISTMGDDEMVDFSIAGVSWGNHYSLTLESLAIDNLDPEYRAVVLVQNFKWSNYVSNIYIVNAYSSTTEVKEFDAGYTMDTLRSKLRLSILPKHLNVYDDGAENIYSFKNEYTNAGKVNVIELDYSFPKEDKPGLEVKATVKMKIENGKVVPYILDVKQKLYN